MTSTPIPDTTLLSWTTPKRMKPQRGRRWYIGAGAFTVFCAVYGIVTGAWSMTLVFALLAAVFWLCHRKPFAAQSFIIATNGFQEGTRFTSWTNCRGFWFLQGPGYVELHIERKSGRNREALTLLPEDVSYETVRELLSQSMPEFSDRRERSLDMIIRLLKI